MKLKAIGFLVLLISSFSSCVEKGCTDPEALNYNSKAQRDDESCNYGDKYESEKEEYLSNYSNLAFAMYTDALESSIALDTAIQTFLKAPNADRLSACKAAWLAASFQYKQCAGFRFSNGPIDGSPDFHLLMGYWPINPSLIDYTSEGSGGLVFDEELIPTISGTALENLTDQNNVLTGLHVIEFLLWGQDVDDPEDLTAGYRTDVDYDLIDSSNIEIQRRRDYLSSLGSLLVSHLTQVRNQWDPTAIENYRARFLSRPVNESMKHVLSGLGTLARAEMLERGIDKPRLSEVESHEISAYSDNSTTDLIAMNRGMESLVSGSYAALDGTVTEGYSLVELATLYDLELTLAISEQLNRNAKVFEDIPAPFDNQLFQEITFGDGPIADVGPELLTFEDLMYELAREMGFGLNTDLPED